jgi:hypothetical protein
VAGRCGARVRVHRYTMSKQSGNELAGHTCKTTELVGSIVCRCAASAVASASAPKQGLTFAHFTAQLEDLRDTGLKLQLTLNTLSTIETHPGVILGHVGDKASLS